VCTRTVGVYEDNRCVRGQSVCMRTVGVSGDILDRPAVRGNPGYLADEGETLQKKERQRGVVI
jgi:hypothetical protein